MKIILKTDKKSLGQAPSTVGIYLFKSQEKIIYIGKSVNLKARLLSHLENSKIDVKEAKIFGMADSVECQVTDSEFKALLLEAELIKTYKPKYNLILKDNKSNLYVKITIKDQYPKVLMSRKEDDGKSLYFGPFPSVRITETILRTIRKVIPYCSQRRISQRGCFYSKINLCLPCPNDIEKMTDENEKLRLKKIYRKQIRQIISIFSGKFDLVISSLKKQLKELIKRSSYEEAIVIRNRILIFERFLNQQLPFDFAFNVNQSQEKNNQLLILLKKFFPQVNSLKRIECYDVSNLSFKEATASMVVFENGAPALDQYRKFKIKNLKLESDTDMLQEVLQRRLRNKWTRPDLIIIDGGKPQIQAVKPIINGGFKDIPLLGIAKNPDRLILANDDFSLLTFKHNDLAFNLVRQIRDESHRFAKKYHLFLRGNKLLL